MLLLVHSHSELYLFIGTVENHGKKMVKNTAHFCKNRKNHGKIVAIC